MSSSYRDLKAWQKAVDLVIEIYRCTRSFPKEEMYGLTGQLRRAAVSVASNIAEGKGRYSDMDFVRFLRQSQGSLFEIETQLTIACRLGLLKEQEANWLSGRAGEIGRMLSGLIASLNRKQMAKTQQAA